MDSGKICVSFTSGKCTRWVCHFHSKDFNDLSERVDVRSEFICSLFRMQINNDIQNWATSKPMRSQQDTAYWPHSVDQCFLFIFLNPIIGESRCGRAAILNVTNMRRALFSFVPNNVLYHAYCNRDLFFVWIDSSVLNPNIVIVLFCIPLNCLLDGSRNA